ncbi:hypothetical protein PLANPX_2793 [Lacipirellula parvula]|uniref:Uncharacterized protein n=1 Tax=Lacipirellula parvula TaxID=2650471 RepID=A0A5K7XE87_9BACT|nr:hypothetical protein PLANPX_2793 [Lacipirellula parvula]
MRFNLRVVLFAVMPFVAVAAIAASKRGALLAFFLGFVFVALACAIMRGRWYWP